MNHSFQFYMIALRVSSTTSELKSLARIIWENATEYAFNTDPMGFVDVDCLDIIEQVRDAEAIPWLKYTLFSK